MKKQRLAMLLDIMIAIALFRIVENLPIPYPRTLAGFWAQRRYIGRPAGSALWLVALWLQTFDAWDATERLTRAAALWCGALMLCVLMTPYAADLITQSNRAKLSQELYGGLMMVSAAACSGLLYALDRADRKGRLALIVAVVVMVAGLAVCVAGYRSAMWMSVAVAAAGLIAYRLACGFREYREN